MQISLLSNYKGTSRAFLDCVFFIFYIYIVYIFSGGAYQFGWLANSICMGVKGRIFSFTNRLFVCGTVLISKL